MVYYVTARYRALAKDVVYRLQAENLSDCYISPLMAVGLLNDKSIKHDAKMALRLDLLTVCDALIVVSEITDEMMTEINLAKLINMEVIYLEN